jgi:thiol-disulfide isomerase/thioredoxin
LKWFAYWWSVAMKKLWKVTVLLLVMGIMVAVVTFDNRVNELIVNDTTNLSNEIAYLPVGTASGELAPDFSGTTLDGEVVTLSELRGKTVLVNIFATWCGSCRAEAPHLVDVDNELGGQVVFVGLNLQETSKAVAGFRDDFSIDFPLVLNEDGALTKIYQPIGLPTSWIIDEEGVVRFVHAGPMTADFLRMAILDVQARREVNPFATFR